MYIELEWQDRQLHHGHAAGLPHITRQRDVLLEALLYITVARGNSFVAQPQDEAGGRLLPIADVLAGLQTGLIDSIGSPPVGAIALQWYTQVEHAIDLPLLYVYGLFAMAERPFNRLSPEHQAIVNKELRAAVAAADGSARRDHESAKSALTTQGIQWATPSDTEFSEWDSLASAARGRIVDAGFVTKDVYTQIESLITEFRAGAR